MLKRKSSLSLMVSKLDTRLIDKFLNLNISKEDLKKFDEMEKKEMISELTDLKHLRNQSESEIYKTLDLMFSNNQYFMYCGPLLLNINPGPNLADDYLNLANWMQKNSGIIETKWKPHLYTMMNNVYHALIRDKKDQVVSFIGEIGSGKTFNLVHSLEYFCFFHSPEGMQMEFFETMHKSMQLMHIMGSIFRENNIESSSCGILMKMGFDESYKICNFELDSKIIDFTLPFSESGRSFSILHSLVTGASPEIKRILDLPDRETTLNFFRKYHTSYNMKTRERFKLNDYEIWTRFHSLLNFFDFSKNEVIEILQLMAFILLCNEAAIGKKRTSLGDEYVINKSVGSKKLSKNLNIDEEDFLKRFGSFKNISEMKNCLISLMKYAYYMVFEFIKNKVKSFLNNYFEKYRPQQKPTKPKIDQSFSQINQTLKNIYFIDIPGEIKDQTLGGLFTNLTNECLNLYTGSEYMCVIDRINSEKVNLRSFQPVHSYYAVESLIGKEGLVNFLSQNFTEKNFKKLKSKISRKEYYYKTMKFIENLSQDVSVDFTFEFKFSNKNIFYNYESLYMETKSLLINPRISKVFEGSRNSIVKSNFKFLSDIPKNFFTYCLNTLADLFKPIEGINPFIIYCIHSNSSIKTFFGESRLDNIESENRCYNIPNLETCELLRNSLIFPIVSWEWFGFHEWIEIDLFIKEFRRDFELVKEKIFKNRFKNLKKKTPETLEDIDLKSLNPVEVVTYILSVLCTQKQYIIGSQHILLKQGTLKKIREVVNNMVNMNQAESQHIVNNSIDGKPIKRSSIDRSKGSIFKRMPSIRSGSTGMIRRGNINTKHSTSSKNIESGNKLTRNNSIAFRENKFDDKNPENTEKHYYKAHCSLKVFKQISDNMIAPLIENDEQNNLKKDKDNFLSQKSGVNSKVNLISTKPQTASSKANFNSLNNYNLNNNDNIELMQDTEINNFINYNNKFNIFNFIAYNKKLEISNVGINDSVDQIHTTNLESEFDMYKRDENVVIPKTKYFNAIKNLFDYSKIDGFHIFDYQEFLPAIKLIQTNWRCYKARKIYKIFRFVCRKCVLIQKVIRAWITKKKYRKFNYANKCIVLIQRLYKRRFFRLTHAATLIQSFYRKKKGFKRYLDKLARKDLGEDDSEEEQDFKNNLGNHEVIARENKTTLKRELQSVSMSKFEKRKSIDQSSLIRRNQLNMSLLAEMEVDTDKRKILDILMNDSSVFKGIANKSVKQLDNDIELFKKNVAGKTTQRNTMEGKKIQDRLIEYGEYVKLKQTEKKIEQTKHEEKSLIFKPQLNTHKQIDLTKHGGKTIQERTDYRKMLREKKLEVLRNKYQEDETELTFKPDINKKSQHIKRSLNDLYKWKEKKELIKQKEINDKMHREEEDIKKNLQRFKVNKNSEFIHKNKQSVIQNQKEENEKKDEELEFDLWPDINKAYVKDEEDNEEEFNIDNNDEIDLHL